MEILDNVVKLLAAPVILKLSDRLWIGSVCEGALRRHRFNFGKPGASHTTPPKLAVVVKSRRAAICN